MTAQHETTADALKSIWISSHDHDPLDEDCSPTKACRNMKDVTFDGYAEPGTDLGAALAGQAGKGGEAVDVRGECPRLDPRSGRIALGASTTRHAHGVTS